MYFDLFVKVYLKGYSAGMWEGMLIGAGLVLLGILLWQLSKKLLATSPIASTKTSVQATIPR